VSFLCFQRIQENKTKRINKQITNNKRRREEIEALQEELVNFQNKGGEKFVLLIGDKGGGSFKLLLQDLSRAKPNSAHSGLLIGEMFGSDTHGNLKTAFRSISVTFLFVLSLSFNCFFFFVSFCLWKLANQPNNQ